MAPLIDFIRRSGTIPDQAIGDPWFEDGNIFLVSDNFVFRYPRYLLVLRAPVISDMLNLENLSDDIVDLVDDCPVFELHDRADDVACFLIALHDDAEIPTVLDSKEAFEFLAGVLRLSTKYNVPSLRRKALRTLESRYPSTLSAWDRLHHAADGSTPWKPQSALLVNLATEMGTASFVPAAMAELTNDVSAGDVFGISLYHANLPHQHEQPEVPLNKHAEREFALMKENNHVSIVKMLKFIRAIGEDCRRPPEVTPSVAGKAPVGAKVLRPKPSTCRSEFGEIAKRLLEKLFLDMPMGYDDFCILVGKVTQDRTRTCRKCWNEFKYGQEQRRMEWWSGLPRVLNYSGWADPLLARVESEGDEDLVAW